jgi:murein DD-endopeptidase MepM/ murein hydrolase activator NlpD
MKKKLLEKDGFYLALFACICLLAVGGVWFTKSNVDELASNNGFVNNTDKNSKSDDELHLIEKDNNDAVPTTTESGENLQQAKEKQKESNSKLSFLGKKVTREYSEQEPSYSKTLNLWEIHKGLDVSANENQQIKSLLAGKIVSVFKDDKHGMSVKVKSENDIVVVYSNLNEKIEVKKDQTIKEGGSLGIVGDTSAVESEEGTHVHIEAFKGKESIDPMSLIK